MGVNSFRVVAVGAATLGAVAALAMAFGSPDRPAVDRNESAHAGTGTRGEARRVIDEHVSARSELGFRLPGPVDTLGEALPRMVYRTSYGEFRGSEALLVGEVSSVSPGRAFYLDTTAQPEIETEIPWDDPRAEWRTFHLTVRVHETLGRAPGSPLIGSELVVGVATSSATDMGELAAAYTSAGRMVWPLIHSPVFDYDPTVLGIVNDGAFLTFVNDNGNLDPAAKEGEPSRSFLSGVETLSQLRRAAAMPEEVVVVAP